jgi:hypothetical protein
MYLATESRVILDKQTVSQLVKTFPAIYGTRRFITAFICPCTKQIKPIHTLSQIRGVRWVDFFLFPLLKSIMKGARFADVAAMQERVTAVLQSIPKEAFADSFQKLYVRCQQCVVKDGDYFEGK